MPIDDTWLARARSFLAKKQSMWANHDLLNAQIVDMFPEALAEIEHLGGEIKELEELRTDLTEDLAKQERISDQLREALVEREAVIKFACKMIGEIDWTKHFGNILSKAAVSEKVGEGWPAELIYKEDFIENARRQLAVELPELGAWEEEAAR